MADKGETKIQKQILDGFKKLSFARLFRNNSGAVDRGGGILLHFGVGGPGGSDLIGWKTIEINQAMVGSKVAVFCAIEVKSEKGRLTEKQKEFIDRVLSSGGIAGCVRSLKEAYDLMGIK